MGLIPFYDPLRSYEENYTNGPFGLFADESQIAEELKPKCSFLGSLVDIPFGIPAGPLLNGKFIKAAWRMGYSIATYKTVRKDEEASFPMPNIIKTISPNGSVSPGETIIGRPDDQINIETDGITNSFGIPSKASQVWQEDMRNVLKEKKSGQMLVVSFIGTKHDTMDYKDYVDDFATTGQLVTEVNPDCLEVNLSYPNYEKQGLLCYDLETTHHILEAVSRIKGNKPLLVKIGYFPIENQELMEKILTLVHQFAQGVVGINTISATIRDEKGNQILSEDPTRWASGVCGVAIRWAGLELVERIIAYKERNGWKDMAVVGVGGIVYPEDYFRYRLLGADAALSASGSMWKPDLAMQIRNHVKFGHVMT